MIVKRLLPLLHFLLVLVVLVLLLLLLRLPGCWTCRWPARVAPLPGRQIKAPHAALPLAGPGLSAGRRRWSTRGQHGGGRGAQLQQLHGLAEGGLPLPPPRLLPAGNLRLQVQRVLLLAPLGVLHDVGQAMKFIILVG